MAVFGVDGALELARGLHFDEPDAAVADGVVVAVAVRLLDDDLVLHAGHVGQVADLLPVACR